MSEEWRELDLGVSVLAPPRLALPAIGDLGDEPTLIVIAWHRDGGSQQAASALRRAVYQAIGDWPPTGAVLVLTNVTAADGEVTCLGPDELTRIVAGSAELRLRAPSVLGIADLDHLVPEEPRLRSTGDLAAAIELARVFVATGTYARALSALERHRFTALTGPPEMGKTAIARMIGLSLLTAGWEVHECIRPEELWRFYAPDRKQVFIADDAFGSTEYRPEAAERWAVELDRTLRTMDDSHWLVWTSRPAPLKAALRRLNREHGVERFPAPAEVQVDARDLDVSEKALILFRHAKRATLPQGSIDLVRAQGLTIVDHEHFTPERIRRFVTGSLLGLDPAVSDILEVEDAVRDELRRPTEAMSASYRALAPEHRAVLVALLDTPSGPVGERELAAAVRRHSQTSFARSPAELVDRLTDHFLRIVEPASVIWVHPSWRDLVIDELAEDREARRAFLRDCSLEGLLLALSSAGGETGERVAPLLVEDGDWDALADRITSLGAELNGPAITRLLATLADARLEAPGGRDELDALAAYALARVAGSWDESRSTIEVGLLSLWLELAADLPKAPPLPDLTRTWIELLPAEQIDLDEDAEIARLDEWTALADLLAEWAPDTLAAFGFPERQQKSMAAVIDAILAREDELWHSPHRELVAQIMRRLRHLASPPANRSASYLATRLAAPPPSPFDEPTPEPRRISRELRKILDTPLVRPPSNEEVVRKVLRDL